MALELNVVLKCNACNEMLTGVIGFQATDGPVAISVNPCEKCKEKEKTTIREEIRDEEAEPDEDPGPDVEEPIKIDLVLNSGSDRQWVMTSVR